MSSESEFLILTTRPEFIQLNMASSIGWWRCVKGAVSYIVFRHPLLSITFKQSIETFNVFGVTFHIAHIVFNEGIINSQLWFKIKSWNFFYC